MTSIDITAGEPAAQRFLYVLQGHATIAAGPIKRRLDPEIYVEVAPAAGSVILSSTSAETTIVAVFEPVSSSPAASRTPPAGGDWTYRQHDRPARFPFYSTPMVVDEQQ